MPGYQRGFTLVEILVAVSIIFILGLLTIPNFLRFNDEQILKNETAMLVQTIRQAQTNAQSRIICDSQPAASWTVTLYNDHYLLSCQKDSGDVSKPSHSYTGGISMAQPDGSAGAVCDSTLQPIAKIVFSQNSLALIYSSDGVSQCPGTATITLASSRLSYLVTRFLYANIAQIVIDKGGAIYAKSLN